MTLGTRSRRCCARRLPSRGNWRLRRPPRRRHRHRRHVRRGTESARFSTASSSSSCSRGSSMGSTRRCSATAASRTPRARLASHPPGSAIPTIATTITLSRPGATTTWRIRTRSARTERPADTRCASSLKQGVVARHGVYQARVPIRQGIEYRGYLWMKTRTVCWCGHDGARGRCRRRAGLRRDADCEQSMVTGRSTPSL